jgi:iron complex transport system ATP-binding protein
MRFEAKGISVAIAGCHIVHDVSFSVTGGEFVGLIGPNGAGKSTLVRAALGLAKRSAGSVAVDGQALDQLSARERARRIAFLPQERRVEWRLPVHDVVMLGRFPHHDGFGGPSAADHAAVDRALEAVDAREIADRPVTVLSGGERSRVLLARALAVEAPLLFVDEPASALDPYHQIHVMEILRERARAGAGVLAVVHDLSLAARFMDRLILLKAGDVLADGPPEEVLSPERLAAAYRIRARHGEPGDERFIVPLSRL